MSVEQRLAVSKTHLLIRKGVTCIAHDASPSQCGTTHPVLRTFGAKIIVAIVECDAGLNNDEAKFLIEVDDLVHPMQR